jgi:predicted Rossmann fold flavoprotein
MRMTAHNSDDRRIVVIGAGAAGIIAAWRAASLGARVLLLEKNDRIGIKILISGGGKCNITHDGPIAEVLRAFRPNEARFIRPACYRFTNRDIVDMLTGRGLEVYTRPDGRIFPLHGTAKDVVAILGSYLEEVGVRVRLNAAVTGVKAEGGHVSAVRMGEERIETRQVVLAVGGSSYPGSGTTGDGWPWAQALGHSIVKVRAALAPIFLDPKPPDEWAGVALRDCLLRARQAGKEIARWRGDMLWTHRGVSGPTVLGISREVAERQQFGQIMLEVDVAPDRPFEELTTNIREWATQFPRRTLVTYLEGMLPNRLVQPVMEAAEVEPSTTGAYLSQKARNRLVTTLKGWTIGRAEHVPLEKGEVVAGGVSLDEVDPQTMRSKCTSGFYLCGEILDVAGPVGGYNLQAAFATGYVAGETAAMDLLGGGANSTPTNQRHPS